MGAEDSVPSFDSIIVVTAGKVVGKQRKHAKFGVGENKFSLFFD